MYRMTRGAESAVKMENFLQRKKTVEKFSPHFLSEITLTVNNFSKILPQRALAQTGRFCNPANK